MLVVVADTSPLNYLTLLGYPEILARIYGRVLIPLAVLQELRHRDAPAAVRSWVMLPPPWLEVTPVIQIDATLPARLGPGERAAISLALEKGADVLLIDDYLGRSEASARGITVNGTLFVVLEAALAGLLNFQEAMTRLRQIGFRFSQGVEDEMWARYGRGNNR
jgi:predicted nucleic acid-binding protein